MCPAAAAGYNACPGSNPLTITCPGGELIRSPKTLTLIKVYIIQRWGEDYGYNSKKYKIYLYIHRKHPQMIQKHVIF